MSIVAGNYGSILTNGAGRLPSGDPDYLEVMTEGWFSGGILSPLLVSPINNGIDITSPITFVWDVHGLPVTSQIQLSRTSDFADIIFDQSGLAETTTITLSAYETRYNWRVRTTDGYDVSPWSETWSLTTSAKVSILYNNPFPNIFFKGRV